MKNYIFRRSHNGNLFNRYIVRMTKVRIVITLCEDLFGPITQISIWDKKSHTRLETEYIDGTDLREVWKYAYHAARMYENDMNWGE